LLVSVFLGSFLIAFSGALVPGPVLSAAVYQTAKHGAKAGVLIATGHSILEMFLTIGLFLGLRSVIGNVAVQRVVGVLGGSMLLFMSYGMFRYRPQSIAADTQPAGGSSGFIEPMVAGVVTSVSNPYWLLWWATVGAEQISRAIPYAASGIIAFFFGHILADYTWYGIVGAALARGRKIAGSGAFVWLIRLFAVLMGAMGIYFIADGLDFIK